MAKQSKRAMFTQALDRSRGFESRRRNRKRKKLTYDDKFEFSPQWIRMRTYDGRIVRIIRIVCSCMYVYVYGWCRLERRLRIGMFESQLQSENIDCIDSNMNTRRQADKLRGPWVIY
jgi:hypothetical protein